VNFKIGDEVVVTQNSYFTKVGATGTITELGQIGAIVKFTKGQYVDSPNERSWVVRIDELCYNTKLSMLLAGVYNEL
jgi:hypothetical protein